MFFIDGFLQLLSGIILGVAVLQIRFFLKNTGYGKRLDHKQFAIHAAVFAFYTLTLFIYYIVFGIIAPRQPTQGNEPWLYICDYIYELSELIEQTLIIAIFINLGRRQRSNTIMVFSPVTIGQTADSDNKLDEGAHYVMSQDKPETSDNDFNSSLDLLDSIVEHRRSQQDLDTKLWCQFIQIPKIKASDLAVYERNK